MSTIPTSNQIVSLAFDCSGGTRQFTKNVYVNINEPDGFFVRSVSYYADVAETKAYRLQSNITGSTNYLCSFVYGQTSTPNTFFVLNSSVNGTYNFSINEMTDSASTDASGFLIVTLEFVKYD